MSSPLAVLRRLRPPADADALGLYVRTRDPLLLADLVRRHGGLVWGVCRRALPHRPDAEDAYQATWLVLAANPGAVRSPAALPAFLHTVAVRVCRRVRHKRPLTASADHLPAIESAVDREALAALDDELAKLPESLRRPLVLCYLDGATQDEAAKSLGLSLSTLKRRLETGKELLRVRLAGRGVDLTAVMTAAGLTSVGAPALVAGGAGVAATALSTEVLTAMWMLKAKTWVAGVVLAAGVSATGGGLMLAGGQGPGGGPPPPPTLPAVAVPVAPVPPPAVVANERGAWSANFQAHSDFATVKRVPFERAMVEEAEKLRQDLAVRWLKAELPNWELACWISHSARPDDPGSVQGDTVKFHGPYATEPRPIKTLSLRLIGEPDRVLADELPRGVLFCVLHTHFGRSLPLWARLGVPALAESPVAQARRDEVCRRGLNTGTALPLLELFKLDDRNPDRLPTESAIAAQGYSLARFLRDRKSGGEAAVVEFLRCGMATDWGRAAEAAGFTSVDALQAAWIESLRKLPVPVAAPAAPASAAPPTSVVPAVPARLLKERIDTARQILALDRDLLARGAVGKEETVGFELHMRTTAQMLHEAVRVSDPSPAGQLAAAREWYVTVRSTELLFKERSDQGLIRPQVSLSVSLARNQAEAALLHAMAVAPPAALNGFAPFAAAPANYRGKLVTGWPVIGPAGVLTPGMALRISRGGVPIGVMVVTHVPDPRDPLEKQEAGGVLLPNPDGTIPAVRVGDDVGPHTGGG